MKTLSQIKDCKYLSSVGLLMSMDENDIITYDKEPYKITHDFNKLLNGKDGCCIYIKFSFIKQFVYQVLPHINYKFILITGDGDETIPNDMFDEETFFSIINNKKIIHWYSINCIEEYHPKLSLIPIGVNYHSSSFGEFCGWHKSAISPLEQEIEIQKIKDNSLPFYERKMKCYSNFYYGINNDPLNVYNKFGNPRKNALEKIKPDLVFYEIDKIGRSETWENQSKYAFVLSPMGNGMDTHRTWEALILGCIVIVKKSPLDSLYENLPVLIVNDWADITENLLKETIENFKEKVFNYDKITLKYWINKIKNKC
jgi:hypothetical protein